MTLAFQRRIAAARAQRAATAASPSRAGLLPLPAPAQVQFVGNLIRGVKAIDDAEKEINTSKAIDTKKEEWMQCCDAEYPDDPHRHMITASRAYPFMAYQMFRESKKRGGNKAQLKNNVLFDHAAYKQVVHAFQTTNGIITEHPQPTKPVGMSVFTQYRAALKELFHEQQAAGQITNSWELVWLPHFKKLQEHVKHRKQKVKRQNYEEKWDGEFAPYTIVDNYPDIEAELWNLYERGARNVCCSLRHRFCTTYLTAGMLRSESLHKAELSDFQGIFVKGQETDVHTMFVMVMMIPFGKTNKGMVRYGRAMRHKDVRLCCIGGCSFFLQYRFHITGEFEDFTVEDWLDNAKWFDIKLLVDPYGDKTKKMQNDSFSDKIKLVLKKLGLSTTKLLHLGRNVGAKTLDLLEELKEEKRNMGQWSPDVVDKSYSSKLPMGPMRKLAGYTGKNSFHYNKRTTVPPPEDLLQATPMGKWCYKAFYAVGEVVSQKDNNDGLTAACFLKFICCMNQVFLEDCAAMLSLHPERANHPMFHDIDVLRSAEFKAHQQRMAKELREDKSPLDATMEHVVPGLCRWHRINYMAVSQLQEDVKDLGEGVTTAISKLLTEAEERRKYSDERLSGILRVLADYFSTGDRAAGESGAKIDLDLVERLLNEESTKAGSTTLDLNSGSTVSAAATVTPPKPSVPQPMDITAQEESINNPRAIARIPMKAQHPNLHSLWNEWHGLEEFQDDFGGIVGREKKFKSAWRKDLVNAQHFSRTKRVVEGITKYRQVNKLLLADAIDQMDVFYQVRKKSLAKMVQFLQSRDLIGKRAPRFKKVHDDNNNPNADNNNNNNTAQ